MKVVKLDCFAQQYAWGKIGSASAVATLKARSQAPRDADVEKLLTSIPKEPFAELWMGTHSSGPSFVAAESSKSKTSLSDWLKGDLAFLFKVLSINKALSVQAHPDKALAEKLHAAQPKVYKDPNHKPEMATALTPFEAMVGFRPWAELSKHLSQFPEFRKLAGEGVADELISFVKKMEQMDKDAAKSQGAKVLQSLMKNMCDASKETIEGCITRLVEHLKGDKVTETPGDERNLDVSALMLRLHGQHGLDVGVMAPLYLNSFRLFPGETVFLGANVPHAYLSGDCVECMACSDNVVRIGLTPKLRDTKTMINMLAYSPSEPAIDRGLPLRSGDKFATCWVPPVPEFCLTEVVLPSRIERYALCGVAGERPKGLGVGHALVLVVKGRGKMVAKLEGTSQQIDVAEGDVYCVPDGTQITLATEDQELVLFWCSKNGASKL